MIASDGYELQYAVWPAHGGRGRGTIILLNGVMSHSGWFSGLADPLARSGLHVVGADRRGSGKNSAARGDTPNAAQLVADVRAIIDAEAKPSEPILLVGWCWGGVLAVNVALEIQARLAGLVLLAPGLWPTAPLKTGMAEELGRKVGAREDECVLESPIVEEWFTAGPALNFIRGDELRLKTFTPRFQQASVKLTMNAIMRLKTLKLPILVVLASNDLATDNTDTRKGLEKLPREQLTIHTLEGMHGLHFDQPEALATLISDFAALRSASG